VTWDDVRAAIVEGCRRLEAAGLVAISSGNVSVRLPPHEGKEIVAITPSSVPYRVLRPEQVLVVDLDGNVVDGQGAASSEKAAHFAAYRARPDVGSVIHSHSIYASALAVAGQELPPIIDEQVVSLGGPVRVAGYAMSATPDLARNAVEALGDRRAVLLRNHGVLGVGRDLDEALNVVTLVERVAQTYVFARLVGGAEPLPESVVQLQLKFYRLLHGLPAEE